MIQDISPRVYDPAFKQKPPEDNDLVLLFDGERTLALNIDGGLTLPTIDQVKKDFEKLLNSGDNSWETWESSFIYLFSIDEKAFYFLEVEEDLEWKGYTFAGSQMYRDLSPGWLAFGGITAVQLARWYIEHKYCPRCGEEMEPEARERALACPECKRVEYPKISPAIIVGITDGDRILMTKYADREYTKYALIAGFSEIGESLEATVHREVMEEVGVKVKNLRYFKSQPWAFSDSLLVGFFADLDGDDTVCIDEEELSEGQWFERSAIPRDNNSTISLTYEMIEAFRDGEY